MIFIVNERGQVLAIKMITKHDQEFEEYMIRKFYDTNFEDKIGPTEIGGYTYKIKG